MDNCESQSGSVHRLFQCMNNLCVQVTVTSGFPGTGHGAMIWTTTTGFREPGSFRLRQKCYGLHRIGHGPTERSFFTTDIGGRRLGSTEALTTGSVILGTGSSVDAGNADTSSTTDR